jgi:hypothetical protein
VLFLLFWLRSFTALHLAVRLKTTALCLALIDAKADINAHDNRGYFLSLPLPRLVKRDAACCLRLCVSAVHHR